MSDISEILDFSKDLNINLLDLAVQRFYTRRGTEAEIEEAKIILQKFQDHPDAWVRADKILSVANEVQSKFLALTILDKLITTRWKALPQEQRLGIRNFIVNVCVGWSNNEEIFKHQRALLNRADLTLVQILKQEWPANWPNFIPEIVNSSHTGFSTCENNMVILRLLSEEIFDFSSEQMTQAKAKKLKQQMTAEFSAIFNLCMDVLEKTNRSSLVQATLQAMLRYLTWVPLRYVFESNLVSLLINKFLMPSEYRNIALKCLTEISTFESPDHNKEFFAMFVQTIEKINQIIPLSTDLRVAYEDAGPKDQDFIQNLAIFLCSFLSHHLPLVESNESVDFLINVHLYLIKISQIDEREMFKGCLDYWATFVHGLYEEIQKLPASELNPLVQQNFGVTIAPSSGALSPEILANHKHLRMHVYAPVLTQLRLVMIEKMARPEEILIVENDEGEIVRELVRESDTFTLYKQMREVLVYLTHLDVVDTEQIMTTKLARQMDGSEWSWNNINTLCWAIGSISGAMNEEMEKRFLVTVIRELLSLTEQQRGKDNKAVVASNIMYIVGQYPRFLKAYWRFLKTVVNKLFEFMHETHEGVQDMACDTFIKISKKCKRHFVVTQSGETEPFIDEIIRTLDAITNDLSPQQTNTFYEACGEIIQAQPNKQTKARLLSQLMTLPNNAWDNMVQAAGQDRELLSNPDNIKIFANVMKANVAVCTPLATGYYSQLQRIYVDMLSLYHAVSAMISLAIAQEGPVATSYPRTRGLRTIKKEVLKLVSTYISKADNLEEIVRDMVPLLLKTVLSDYNENVPNAREAEVLRCMNVVVSRMGGMIPEMVLGILEHVFESTLEMIDKDMLDFPEHRVEFFNLLRTINLNSFEALIQLPEHVFSRTVEACLWASKHDNREVESAGLLLTLEMINNMANLENQEIANVFFKKYLKGIIGDIFFVMTDADHKAGFRTQTQILARIIELIVSRQITVPLYDENEAQPGTSNVDFLKDFLKRELSNSFSHLQPEQISVFVEKLVATHNDALQLKGTLRDFLVQIREIGGESTDYLFAEEQEAAAALRQQQDHERAMKIGGLLKPSEIAEDMDD